MAIKRKRIKAVIQFRRATESEWVAVDPILRIGEPALSIDKNMIKIGDGSTAWSQLSYITDFDYSQIKNLPKINNITLLNNKTSADLGLQDEMDVISESDIDRIIFGGL